MHPDLRGLAARQGGLFTRRQAVDAGHSEREIKTRTGALGDWATVRRGVYLERAAWESLAAEARYLTRVRAAQLATTRPAVLSHSSAAAILGMPLRPRWCELVHVTRPGVTGGRTEGGVKHHLAGYRDADVFRQDGLLVTRPARTAIDVGREFGLEDGVIACDAAMRAGTSREQLAAALAPMRSWPHVTRARAAASLADPGAASVGESRLRLLVLELRIGSPETQYLIEDSGRRAYADLRLGRHLFEFDGRVKYLGREQGGVATTSPERVVWEEKQREDWLRSLGYGVSRVVWDELAGPRRAQTKARLLREVNETRRRVGRDD